MYRPVTPSQGPPSVKELLFSGKNYQTLQTVLSQDFQERHGSLSEPQVQRLAKTVDHYLHQVYQKQGDKPISVLNKEVLTAASKDFSQYLQRKEAVKNVNPVKQVMDDSLFQETSTRFEKLTQERNEMKALPSSIPDFRISLREDGPPAAEIFEKAKKQREMEFLRSTQQNNELHKADTGLQQRIQADQSFRALQDGQNRDTELALVQRQSQRPVMDQSLMIMPDRRELMLAPVGSFDTMTQSPNPRELGQGNSDPTTVYPLMASPVANKLPQNNIIREDDIIGYREIENNLFLYSADRDWLTNSKENRYHFTVQFDTAGYKDKFGVGLASQQKFKNIVRIELIKAIMPGESLDVSVNARGQVSTTYSTTYQDNILNLPYVSLRIAELENNNYGTDNFLDRSFGVLQYDAQWLSDATQTECTRGFLAMIPKFLKCQKEYYPTPLSTLQKMTIEFLRPNGELLSASSDTFNVGGIIAPHIGAIISSTFPFNVDTSTSPYSLLKNNSVATTSPANFFLNTSTYFSRFELCTGDRIQIKGYTYSDASLNDPTYGQSLRAFCNWVNRNEGHIILNTAYTLNNTSTVLQDGVNHVGYANFVILQADYQDPSTGSTLLQSFGDDFGRTLTTYGPTLESPIRLINLNKQLNLVFRIITREMDSLPQIRPDNNY
jgi:hypothetical protein|uniref:Uncharacterized protein n=1 Tax=viral metagenome TaxID=1070528 RepID=A0A6C0BGQ0_9ZZZZ